MAVQAKRGSFTANTSTGNQAITGVGFQPDVVLFMCVLQTATGDNDHHIGSFGAAKSSTNRWATAWASDDGGAASNGGKGHRDAKCILLYSNGTPTVDAEADFVSQDSNGFTINWTNAPASAVIVEYLALRGMSVFCGNGALNGGAGDKAFTGVGFTPEALLMVTVANATAPPSDLNTLTLGMFGMGFAVGTTAHGTMAMQDQDSVATSNIVTYQSSAKALSVALGSGLTTCVVKTMDSDGFTLTQTGGSSGYFFYVALAGADLEVQVVNDTQRTSTGTQSQDVDIAPQALIGFGNGINTADDSIGVLTRDGRISIGFRDTSSEASIWCASQDNVAPNTARGHSQSKFLRFLDQAKSLQAECDASIDAEGYTLDWTTADATARKFNVLVIGNVASTAYERTPGETLLMNDAVTVSVGRSVAQDDAAGVTDSPTPAVGHGVSPADALALTDTAAPVGVYQRTVDDALAITDAGEPAFTGDFVRNVAETLDISDDHSLDRSLVLVEALDVSDALRLSRFLELADNLDITDSTAFVLALSQLLADPLAITDSLDTPGAFFRSFSETLTLTDTLTRQADYSRDVADSLGITDDLSMGRFIVIPLAEGALDITDGLAFARSFTLTELLALTDEALVELAPLLPPPHFRPHQSGFIAKPYSGLIVRRDPRDYPGFIARPQPGTISE